jgi:DNA polymerase-3 subunit gamma/tau
VISGRKQMFNLDYRPFSFDEMAGQKGIIDEMKKRSITMDFPKVMIFAGPSGTGKTTLSRIITALLNDPNPIVHSDGTKDPNPESAISKAVMQERFMGDVSIHDASSMDKEALIKLKQTISMAPMYEKNRVVVIDEAQELSKAGKGATLDMLERKRSNCYIILCTMDLDSFPPAVKDRCQIYNFRNPTPDTIFQFLFDFMNTKFPQVEATEEFFVNGLSMIANNSYGSVRRALQLLDRCLTAELFTVESMQSELYLYSEERISDLVIKVLKRDATCIQDIMKYGVSDFFYHSKRILMDAFVYKGMKVVKSGKTDALVSQLVKYTSLDSLVQKYVDMGVFNEELFWYTLTKFYMEKVERLPV